MNRFKDILLSVSLLFLLAFTTGSQTVYGAECVRIFYDKAHDASNPVGKTYAIFLANLLGHFPQYETIIEPIEHYKKGEIDSCHASFYIGSYFENAIPSDFLADFESTQKQVVWMKYSVWKYSPDRLSNLFGVRYVEIKHKEWEKPDADGRAGFFKFIKYKGETFAKYGEFAEDSNQQFNSDAEMVVMEPIENRSLVLAEAVHSGTRERTPYIIRNKNRFYIADIPFTYLHEKDRYLVFSDLLFDILNVQPLYTNKKPAVIRIDGIGAHSPRSVILGISDLLQRYKVPFLAGIVPVTTDSSHREVPIDLDGPFQVFVKEIYSRGATLVWNGVTHRNDLTSQGSRSSGGDFEFWNSADQQALPNDSVDFALNKLEKGWQAFSKAGWSPTLWETPLYRASVLDNYVFGRVFPWTIGRNIYSSHHRSGLNLSKLTPHLWYSETGTNGTDARRQALNSLQVSNVGPVSEQFFPYEIYGDIYGMRIIPENSGAPQRNVPRISSEPHSVDEMIVNLRRNKVLRDCWGSLYLRAEYFQDPNDPTQVSEVSLGKLKELIESMQNNGYEFIDTSRFTQVKSNVYRPIPVFHN